MRVRKSFEEHEKLRLIRKRKIIKCQKVSKSSDFFQTQNQKKEKVLVSKVTKVEEFK